MSMHMDSLRVGGNIKTIEVNDAGEYISIPIGDTTFFERFGNIIKYFEQKKDEIDRQEKELAEKHAGKPADDIDRIMDNLQFYTALCKEVCDELDKLFGEGCCRKVFAGIEAPDVELIGEFFEQITPLLQKYFNERNEKIHSRYNRARKGAMG